MKLWAIIIGGVLAVAATLSAHAQSAPPPPPPSAPPAQRPVPTLPMTDGKRPVIGVPRAPGAAPPVAPSSELVSPSERSAGTTTDSGRSSVEPDPQRPGAR